jgi:hypothetical protein
MLAGTGDRHHPSGASRRIRSEWPAADPHYPHIRPGGQAGHAPTADPKPGRQVPVLLNILSS